MYELKKHLSFFVVILSWPCLVFANEQTAVINEICWIGSASSSNDEWIELYNAGQKNIKLDGWVLKTADDGIKINLKGEIPSGEFFLLERTDDNSAATAKADLIYQGALSNNGENLKIIDNNGNVVDEVNCAKGWFAGDNKTKQTMERNPSTSSGQAIWQTSQNPGGTPGQPNSKPSGQQETTKPLATSTNLTNKEIPVPISSSATTSQNEQKPPITNSADRPDLLQKIIPSNIFLNEIMPSPEGSDSENEWIELYNANNFEADISGWKIRDKIGAVKTYAFPENTKIEANSFLILKRPQIKISLNNEGDGLELLNPNGKIIDSIDYEKAKQGQSWSKTENDWPAESPAGNQAGWQWTAKPTPGAANVIVKTTTQAIAKTLPTSSQNEKLLLAQAGTPSAGSGQGAAPKNKNILAVVIAALLAAGSAVIAWQIKKKSTEI